MNRFKNILCVIDPENSSATALERAVALAEHNQAGLTVAAVAGGMAPMSGEDSARSLERLTGPYGGRAALQTTVLTGTPFLEIIREVLRGGHDLVIKLAEHPRWLPRLFGSDDMHLLRKCPCPVWLLQPGEPGSYRRILAAVDVDDTYPPAELETRHALNRRTLELALSLARADAAELHVAHVWDAIAEDAVRWASQKAEEEVIVYVEQARRHHAGRLDALLHEVTAGAADYPVPRMHLVKGYARRDIPVLAKEIEADLIVMGTVARTGIPGFIIGNTAETILGQMECAVLAVKPPGFITPVTVGT